jgi:hypothetical protein
MSRFQKSRRRSVAVMSVDSPQVMWDSPRSTQLYALRGVRSAPATSPP